MPAYKLLLEFDSYDELKNYLDKSPATQGVAVAKTIPADPATIITESAAQNAVAATSPEPEDGTPPFLREKKKPGRKPKAEVTPQPETETAEEKPKAQPAKPVTPEIPYKTIQEATMNFHKTFGRQKTLEVLGEFGVNIATDLKADQYPAYLKRIEELSAEGELA